METAPNDYERSWRITKEVPHEALVNTKIAESVIKNRGEVYELLQIRNVSHCFFAKENAKLILENMSLQVEEGEFISILGPSGLRQNDTPLHYCRAA